MWIRIQTTFTSSAQAVFDISRDIDLHIESGKEENERVIAGRSTGLMEKGETVTWEARHLGVTQRMKVVMEEAVSPSLLVTKMETGPFAYFIHFHRIESFQDKTVLIDDVFFEAPLGFFGWLSEILFLKKHLTHVIKKRNHSLKKALGEV